MTIETGSQSGTYLIDVSTETASFLKELGDGDLSLGIMRASNKVRGTLYVRTSNGGKHVVRVIEKETTIIERFTGDYAESDAERFVRDHV